MLSLYHIQMNFPKQPQVQVTKFGTNLCAGSRYLLSLYESLLLYTMSITPLRVSCRYFLIKKSVHDKTYCGCAVLSLVEIGLIVWALSFLGR